MPIVVRIDVELARRKMSVGEFAERYLDTDAKRRSARAAYFAGAEATRRCWDAYEGVAW